MPILPGVPVNTQGVSPFVQIMQQGVAGIGQGAALASARISQNQQGLSSFLRDSLTQSLAIAQRDLEERKFKVQTGLEIEGLRLREDEMGQRAALAASRERRLDRTEGRLQGQWEDEQERKRMMEETIMGMINPTALPADRDPDWGPDMGSGGGHPTIPQKDWEPTPGPKPWEPGYPAEGQFWPSPQHHKEPWEQTQVGESLNDPSMGDQKRLASFEGEESFYRTGADLEMGGGPLPGQTDPPTASPIDRQINRLRTMATLYTNSGNYSAAIGMINQMDKLQATRDMVQGATPETHPVTMQVVNEIRNGYDPLAYLNLQYGGEQKKWKGLPHPTPERVPQTEGAALHKLMLERTPVRLAEGQHTVVAQATAAGNKTPIPILDKTAQLLHNKAKSLEDQWTASLFRVQPGEDGAVGKNLLDEFYSPRIQEAKDRAKLFTDASIEKSKNIQGLHLTGAEIKKQIETTKALLLAGETSIDGWGKKSSRDSKGRVVPGTGQIGALEASRDWMKGIRGPYKADKDGNHPHHKHDAEHAHVYGEDEKIKKNHRHGTFNQTEWDNWTKRIDDIAPKIAVLEAQVVGKHQELAKYRTHLNDLETRSDEMQLGKEPYTLPPVSWEEVERRRKLQGTGAPETPAPLTKEQKQAANWFKDNAPPQ